MSDIAKSHTLRVVMVAEDFSRVSGGVPAVVYQLSERMAAMGLETHVVFSHVDPMEPPKGVVGHYVPATRWGRSWYWSPALKATLTRLAMGDVPTVFHVHGVWSGPQKVASSIARRFGIPYIVSAHGMLEPWLWTGQGFLKRLKKEVYWRLSGRSVFNEATLIHAITPLESRNLAKLSPLPPRKWIPNAIEIRQPLSVTPPPRREKSLLFLGRIEAKKGVDILLRAFAMAPIDAKWKLIVAGPSWSDTYLEELRSIVATHHLESRVHFPGPVFAEQKLELLSRAWAMITPSHSEVVGLVNLEAALYELPSVTTYETGLDDWEDGGGILVRPTVNALAQALAACCGWTEEERDCRGRASWKLVNERYNWETVQDTWLTTYKLLLQSHPILPG